MHSFRRRGNLGDPAVRAARLRGRRGHLGNPAIRAARLPGRLRHLRLLAVLGLTLLGATGAAAQAGAPARRAALQIEVADVGPNRVLCMNHGGAALAPGTTIWLVQPDTPQSVARAAPGSGECPPWPDPVQKTLVPLRVVGGTLDSMRLSIAIVAPAHEPVVRHGRVEADLDGDGVPERFRACAGGEGAHLTVWAGSPGRGRLRWHRYFYLGYDVVTDCTEADYREPAPAAALGRPSSPSGQ